MPPRDARGRCTATSAVETKGLGKHYGYTVSLDHIDLKIEKGQVFGVVGGRGAGKSTLIRVLATLLQPDAGAATVNGHDIITEPVQVRESIGVALEDLGIYSRMTPRENLKLFGRLRQIKGKALDERLEEMLSAFNLHAEADEPCTTLSQSQKRRLSIALAAIHNPPILLIDIPTTDLDIITTRLIDSFLAGYAEGEATVIRTTRSLVEARLSCQKMAVLKTGFLVAQGSIAELEDQSQESGLQEALAQLGVEES